MAMYYEMRAGGKTFTGTLIEILEGVLREFLPEDKANEAMGRAASRPEVTLEAVTSTASIVTQGTAYISGRRVVNR